MKRMKVNDEPLNRIHALLKRTVIPPASFEAYVAGNSEPMHKQLEPLYNYLSDNTPAKLYRLRKFSKHSVDALKDGEIYFTRANSFNDPYDCLLHIDDNILKDNIKKQLSNKIVFKELQSSKYKPIITEINKDFDEILEIFNQFKDGFIDDAVSRSQTVVDLLQRSTYITCFTENIKSPIMWSHYADYHYGFAIEYDFQPSFFYPSPHFPEESIFYGYGWRSLLPVHYSKYRADASALVDWYTLCEMRKKIGNNTDASCYISDMLLKTKLCLEKSEAWSYEKEWRLILTFEWPYSFPNYRIGINYNASAVYLGSRMKKRNKQQLINICKKQNIPVYQMKIIHSSREYCMDYEQII